MAKQDNRAYLGKTNMALLRGDEDVALWDDEELLRGHRRDKNGNWGGRPPKVIPKAVHDELVRRTRSVAQQVLTTSLEKAITTMVALLDDPDPTVRYNAAKWIAERLLGKEPVRVEVKAKWEEALETSVVTLAVLDAEIIANAIDVDGEEGDPFA